jgi:hypothetical protein
MAGSDFDDRDSKKGDEDISAMAAPAGGYHDESDAAKAME